MIFVLNVRIIIIWVLKDIFQLYVFSSITHPFIIFHERVAYVDLTMSILLASCPLIILRGSPRERERESGSQLGSRGRERRGRRQRGIRSRLERVATRAAPGCGGGGGVGCRGRGGSCSRRRLERVGDVGVGRVRMGHVRERWIVSRVVILFV